jgi:hypothetical protein
MRQLGTLIAHDNQQWLHYYGAQYLPYQPILQGLGILPVTPASKLTFRALAGQEFTLDVFPGSVSLVSAPAAATGPLPLYLQNSSLNYWFTYSAPLHLLLFQIQLVPGDGRQPVRRLCRQTSEHARRQPRRHAGDRFPRECWW